VRLHGFPSLGLNILRSNFSRLPHPYKLTFALTYWCNYKCKTCNIWERKPRNELSLDEIRQFFNTSSRFNWIDFTGGEVWLRKDFTDIVSCALESCPQLALIHFPTNGYLTDKIVAGVKQIVSLKPSKFIVTVSLDGDERLNDTIRGIKGGWKRQIETYKKLHAINGVEVVLGMTISDLNAGQYQRTFEAVKDECPWLTPKDMHMNVAHQSSHYYGNGPDDNFSTDKETILSELRNYRKNLGIPTGPVSLLESRYLGHAETYLKTGVTPMRCHSLRSSCFLDPWGNVYPCGMYDAKIANIRDHDYSLAKIWQLDETRSKQKEIWNLQCPQCWTPCEAYQSILGNALGNVRTTKPGAVLQTVESQS